MCTENAQGSHMHFIQYLNRLNSYTKKKKKYNVFLHKSILNCSKAGKIYCKTVLLVMMRCTSVWLQSHSETTKTREPYLWGCWGPRRSLWPRLAGCAGRLEQVHTEKLADEHQSVEHSGLPPGRRTRCFPHTSTEARWAEEDTLKASVIQVRLKTKVVIFTLFWSLGKYAMLLFCFSS